VIFINLTGSFSVGFLCAGSTVSRPQEPHRYTLLPLLLDLFYGVQGKFLGDLTTNSESLREQVDEQIRLEAISQMESLAVTLHLLRP